MVALKEEADAAVAEALRVPGLTGADDLRVLYLAARNLRLGGCIVEIGSFKGRSTVALGLGLRDGKNDSARIYSVDPFLGNLSSIKQKSPTFDEFLQNINAHRVQDFIRPLCMTSLEAAKQWPARPIDLLWIDGWHAYPAPAEDVRAWKPFLARGRMLLMDDVYTQGVFRSVKEELIGSPDFNRVWIGRGIAFAVKGPCDWPGRLVKRAYFWVRRLMAYARWGLRV